jgi:hypothetical protein
MRVFHSYAEKSFSKLRNVGCEIPTSHVYTKMLTIAISIRLAHQGFRAIIVAFHKPVGDAERHKREKGEDLLSPLLDGGERFAQGLWPLLLNLLNPAIQFRRGSGGGGGGVPDAERFCALSGGFQEGTVRSTRCALLSVFLRQIFFGL